MRRTLARARDGKPLDVDEATVLLHARGEDLNRLLDYASRTRDAGLAGRQAPRRHHLLAQGLHPAHPAVPGPLRLLHVRDRARTGCTSLYLEPDEVLAIARQGAELGCKEALFTLGDKPEDRWQPGPGVAGRARLRRHPVLRPGDGDPRPGGDRPAAAPEPRGAVLAGLPAAQAGRPVHGHDAGDDREPPVQRPRAPRTSAARTRTRPCACASWRTPAAATSRSPPAS